MIYGNSKRIVIVKDIPSNIIEEAILILKQDPSKASSGSIMSKKSNKDSKKVSTDYLMKEAETIINSYINEHKIEEAYNHRILLGKKFIADESKKTSNIILNTGIAFSLGLLLFVLSRLFM